MISMPTINIIGRSGIRFTTRAATGAASTPPMIKPNMMGHNSSPTVRIKVPEIATVTRNSLALAEPIAVRATPP
jgi:hypothetical protein